MPSSSSRRLVGSSPSGDHGLEKLLAGVLPWWLAWWGRESQGACLNKLEGALPWRRELLVSSSITWWLATKIWWLVAVWLSLPSCRSTPDFPRISSCVPLIQRRFQSSLLFFIATMVVVSKLAKEGMLGVAGGFCAHQQWLFRRGYGDDVSPDFNATPLLLLVERRPYISSSQPVCFRGGSLIFSSEFMARQRCCEGQVAPSGSSPVVAWLHPRRSSSGPDCVFKIQFRVFFVKARGLCGFFYFVESLSALCTVTARI